MFPSNVHSATVITIDDDNNKFPKYLQLEIFFKTPQSLLGNPFHEDPVRTMLSIGYSVEQTCSLATNGGNNIDTTIRTALGGQRQTTTSTTGTYLVSITSDWLAPADMFGHMYEVVFDYRTRDITSMKQVTTYPKRLTPLQRWCKVVTGVRVRKVHDKEVQAVFGTIKQKKRNPKIVDPRLITEFDLADSNVRMAPIIGFSPPPHALGQQQCIPTREDYGIHLFVKMHENMDSNAICCLRCHRRKVNNMEPVPGCTSISVVKIDTSAPWSMDNLVRVCCFIANTVVPNHPGALLVGKRVYTCGSCGENGDGTTHKKCVCGSVAYCSKACQRTMWKTHKLTCPTRRRR
jgi:hypothetical protein